MKSFKNFKEIYSVKTYMADRILTLDYLRGFAIAATASFHILLLTCILVAQAQTDPFSLPPVYLVITLLVAILAHWRGFFLIISAIVNMYSMVQALEKGVPRKKILKKQVSFGLILWIWGVFREVFFNEWSIPKIWLETGSFTQGFLSYWNWIYLAEALENIAWAIILTAIIFYFLSANDGWKNSKRNAIIFGLLSFIIIIISAPIRDAAFNFWGPDIDAYYTTNFKGWWDYVLRFVTNQWIARESPLLPMLAYSFCGNVLGILLSRKKGGRDIVKKSYFAGLILIISGILWLIFITGFPENIGDLISFHIHPDWFVLLSLGMQIIAIMFAMSLIEFNKKVNIEKAKKYTKSMRRWGILALTIYSFMSLQYLVRWILSLFPTPYDFRNEATLPFEISLLVIALVMILWEIIIRLWEKGGFKFSLEWFILKIAKKGKAINQTDPLNIKGILHDVKPILWVKPDNIEKSEYKFIEE